MLNLSLYVGGVYVLHANVGKPQTKCFERVGFNASDVHFIHYKVNAPVSKYSDYKMTALVNAAREASHDKSERFVVILDDIEFTAIEQAAESFARLYAEFDILLLNPGDISEDCWMFTRKAAEFIAANAPDNMSEKGWFDELVIKMRDAGLTFGKLQVPLCEHPIDVVITYVDGNDKEWQDTKKLYSGDVKSATADADIRYRSYGSLEYNLSCIRKNMPYVRSIFVIMQQSSQTPAGLDFPAYGAVAVYHEEFMDKCALPTYNSRTIEMFLWNIPGLSEYFVYMNDDMYVIGNLPKEQLFFNGKTCVSFKKFKNRVSIGFNGACLNSWKTAASEFENAGTPVFPIHSITPMTVSSCAHVYMRHKDDIKQRCTRFRNGKVNLNQYVFPIYDRLAGKCQDSTVNFKYAYINDFYNGSAVLDIAIAENCQVLCVNDNDNVENETFVQSVSKFNTAITENTSFGAAHATDRQLKIALCAIAKNENLYIREWVEYYKKLGISRIFLYDNNNNDGERFEDVIGDYINIGFVCIINVRGQHKSLSKTGSYVTKYHGIQQDCYENCYANNKDSYDWICFVDIDEFIYCQYDFDEFLKEYTKDTDVILLNWQIYGDNDELIYSNRNLQTRFLQESTLRTYNHVKSIVNCKIKKNIVRIDAHLCVIENGVYRDSSHNIIKCDYKKTLNLDNCYIKHYLTKTIEEWILRKYHNTSATGKDFFNENMSKRIQEFFTFNNNSSIKYAIAKRTMRLMDAVNVKIVVSLTSFGERLYNDAYIAISSIIKQTKTADKICLTVYKDDIQFIPKQIRDLESQGALEIIIAERNLKPHLKYFYVMQKYRDSIVITIDDDHIYSSDFIESLYNTHIKYPTCVVARRCHNITLDNFGNVMPYKKWQWEYSKQLTPGKNLFATGVGGVLYPANILELSNDNLENIVKCINADDIYLKWLENKLNVNVVWAKNTVFCKNVIKSKYAKVNRLQDINCKKNKNDEYLKIFDCNYTHACNTIIAKKNNIAHFVLINCKKYMTTTYNDIIELCQQTSIFTQQSNDFKYVILVDDAINLENIQQNFNLTLYNNMVVVRHADLMLYIGSYYYMYSYIITTRLDDLSTIDFECLNKIHIIHPEYFTVVGFKYNMGFKPDYSSLIVNTDVIQQSVTILNMGACDRIIANIYDNPNRIGMNVIPKKTIFYQYL